MSLGTGLTNHPDLVVSGVTLESGAFSDVTGCLSATVAHGVCETGFAGPCCSGAIDILCLVGLFVSFSRSSREEKKRGSSE